MQINDRDRVILEKVIQHCVDIEYTVQFFGEDFETFKSNKIYLNASAMSVLQIGELCGHLTVDFRKAFPDIPWQAIKGMRNIVVHNYGKISATILWETIHGDVVDLKGFCNEILLMK